jgi:hypothetical protein
MTDEEKRRVLQMIFCATHADHTVDRLRIEFKAQAGFGALRGRGSGATAARAGHPHACYYFGAEDGTRTGQRYLRAYSPK